MHITQLKALIEQGLADSHAIVDGDGHHFNAIVISSAFTGKNRVQRQQLVYQLLRDNINDGSLHAISMKTYTPIEWQEREQQLG